MSINPLKLAITALLFSAPGVLDAGGRQVVPITPSFPVFRARFGRIEEVRKQALVLREELEQPGRGGQCFALETLEGELQEMMRGILREMPLLRDCGNKHNNLVSMASLVGILGLPWLKIPFPHCILSSEIEGFLREKAPEIFRLWGELQELQPTDLDHPGVRERLEAMQQAIDRAFTGSDFPFSSEVFVWLQEREARGDFLMVRSTGHEDSREVTNAGGNTSEAYVAPRDLFPAIANVLKSYFGIPSLQNRLRAGVNPFSQPLQFPILLQELIGEEMGGALDPAQIPISFVLFTNEPLFIHGEEFRVMRLSATWGHGEGVVGNRGIGTDTFLILRSVAQPDQLYLLREIQDKPMRLAPLQREERIELGEMANPEEFARQSCLTETQILQIYRSGVLMEAFFERTPTDIEGVFQREELHFVQARPVNRKPLLPTYLKIDSEAIEESYSAQLIVPGKASVVAISKREEALLATTLKEAEERFQADLHKLVVVLQPEPKNSHPVANFSHLRVPCLYARDAEAVQKILARINEEYWLATCVQSATLHLWKRSASPLEEAIVEGFAVHPAEIAISLPASDRLVRTPVTPSSELEELLSKVSKDPKALVELEQHPLLQSFQRKILSFEERVREMTFVPKGVKARMEVLRQLKGQIDRASQEIRAANRKQGARLETLLHVKVLKTLLVPTSASALSQYSLPDAEPLFCSIERLFTYQESLPYKAHCDDLLLLGEEAPSEEAFARWNHFLLQLEPLLEQHQIEPQEFAQFQEFLSILQKSDLLPFWLTFSPPPAEDPLPWIRQAIAEIGPAETLLLDQLLQKQRALDVLRNQLDRFADSKSFPAAWEELQKHLSLPPSSASPTVRSAGYKVIEKAVTLLDLAAKKLKSSQAFAEALKTALFKQMLFPYFELMQNLARSVSPGVLPLHEIWPLDIYLRTIGRILGQLPDSEAGQLLPSRGFSVSAARLGSATAFERHFPETLEDMLTLLHQNCLTCLEALSRQTLQQIQDSLLPTPLKNALQIVQQTNWEFAVQQLGMRIAPEEIEVRYNVPLRNHSGEFHICYDVFSNQLILRAKLLGQARERWNQVGFLAELVSGVFSPERPISVGEQEIQFSWRVTPENLMEALREYMEMARFSLGGTASFSEVFRRVHLQYELRATGHFLNTLQTYMRRENREIQSVILETMISMIRFDWRELEIALEAVKIGDESGVSWLRSRAFRLMGKLVSQDHGYEEAIQLAIRGLQDEETRSWAYTLFYQLFEKGQGLEEAWTIIKTGEIRDRIKILHQLLLQKGHSIENNISYDELIEIVKTGIANNGDTKWSALYCLELLVMKGHGFEAAIEFAKTAIHSNNWSDRSLSVQLLSLLVERGMAYEFALEAVKMPIADDDILMMRSIFQLCRELLRRGQGVEGALERIQTGIRSSSPDRVEQALFTLETLIERIGPIPSAVQLVEQLQNGTIPLQQNSDVSRMLRDLSLLIKPPEPSLLQRLYSGVTSLMGNQPAK